jgi:hypothetical protein
MSSASENLLLTTGISGCPVNPPIYVFTVAASISIVWMADTVTSAMRLGAIHAYLFFPFYLHHSGIVDDDFDRPKSNPIQRP